jgi:hypothetical protein
VPVPAAPRASDRERRLADVGQRERAVAGHRLSSVRVIRRVGQPQKHVAVGRASAAAPAGEILAAQFGPQSPWRVGNI